LRIALVLARPEGQARARSKEPCHVVTRRSSTSIIVPRYNEEPPTTLDRLHAFLSQQPLRYEILVVDDGSRDNTCGVVEQTMTRIPNLRLVRQTPNRGKGAAVRMGMLAARGQLRVMCDADCSMPPEQLPRLIAPIVECRAEIAIGSRYAEGAKTDVKHRATVLWSRSRTR
jgi:glycosyltransferase involved in cell wall biosynthesis